MSYETIITGTAPAITVATTLNGALVHSVVPGGVSFAVPITGGGVYPGGVRQRVSFFSGALATGTTTMAIGTGIPQNSEGVQYLAVSITPQSATSVLHITVSAGLYSPSAVSTVTMAVFRDAGANALAASALVAASGGGYNQVITLVTPSVAAVSTTFRMRMGMNAAGTLTFNGYGGVGYLGGVCSSGITIMEVGA